MGRSRVGVVLACLVVVTAPLAVAPLQDAVTGRGISFARSVQPLAYLAGAPLFGLWDTLSLLTLSQHYAVLVSLVILYAWARRRACLHAAAVDGDGRARRPLGPPAGPRAEVPVPPDLLPAARVTAGRLNVGLPGVPPGALPPLRRMVRVVLREGLFATGALAGLLALYAAGLVLPRPMTGIDLVDPDQIAIDFHSHTNRSHDGWAAFDAGRNRAWHEAGGFDVAYVTDHYTWRGFDEAAIDNPELAGERTVLLSGAEIRIHRRPTNALGDRARYIFALDADSVYMSPDSIAAAHERGARPPTLLYTMPGGLQYVVPLAADVPAGVVGIELNDGSPRGLEQVKAQRREIIALADSADLALLGAANLHGWGRTVASWSVMRIPGWREMSPEALEAAIDERLHAERRDAVEVVERRMPYHAGSKVGLVLTLPRVALEHFRMLTVPERLSWLVWIAVLVAFPVPWRRRRQGAAAGGRLPWFRRPRLAWAARRGS